MYDRTGPFSIWGRSEVKPPRILVIHHTGDHEHEEQATLVEKNHAGRGYSQSSMGSHIAYHFLIGKDGTTRQNRSLYERTMHTRNGKVNSESIAIVVAGNFEIEQPSPQQLAALASLIKRLDATYRFEQIITHKDASPTSCAGKNLELAAKDLLRRPPKTEIWNITRYYSPQPGQLRYYGKSYLADVEINCGLNKDGTAGDCSTTANGHKLQPHEAFTIVACPREMPFGTKLIIEGIGPVTCHDRGGAITNKRLDVWAGYGMDALKAMKTKPGGYLRVTFPST